MPDKSTTPECTRYSSPGGSFICLCGTFGNTEEWPAKTLIRWVSVRFSEIWCNSVSFHQVFESLPTAFSGINITVNPNARVGVVLKKHFDAGNHVATQPRCHTTDVGDSSDTR